MTARAFEVTLISGSVRIVRTVIAHSAITATRSAMSYMPCTAAPLAIICKPLCALVEEESCAA